MFESYPSIVSSPITYEKYLEQRSYAIQAMKKSIPSLTENEERFLSSCIFDKRLFSAACELVAKWRTYINYLGRVDETQRV